jgi:hypothetical protein
MSFIGYACRLPHEGRRPNHGTEDARIGRSAPEGSPVDKHQRGVSHGGLDLSPNTAASDFSIKRGYPLFVPVALIKKFDDAACPNKIKGLFSS